MLLRTLVCVASWIPSLANIADFLGCRPKPGGESPTHMVFVSRWRQRSKICNHLQLFESCKAVDITGMLQSFRAQRVLNSLSLLFSGFRISPVGLLASWEDHFWMDRHRSVHSCLPLCTMLSWKSTRTPKYPFCRNLLYPSRTDDCQWVADSPKWGMRTHIFAACCLWTLCLATTHIKGSDTPPARRTFSAGFGKHLVCAISLCFSHFGNMPRAKWMVSSLLFHWFSVTIAGGNQGKRQKLARRPLRVTCSWKHLDPPGVISEKNGTWTPQE